MYVYVSSVHGVSFFLKVTESEDVADGVQEHCLLQNWLPVFALEPGCLWFPQLLGEAETGRSPSPRTRGSEGLGRGAGRCWGRAGLVLGGAVCIKGGT